MILYTDASELAMGGVIGHKINRKFFPIAYGSSILNDIEQKYPSFKREFMAIKHFISFLEALPHKQAISRGNRHESYNVRFVHEKDQQYYYLKGVVALKNFFSTSFIKM